MELIGDLLPPGVLNIVNGYGAEAGQALATSTRIAKIAFTGSTPVGHHICAARRDAHPSTVELGGKSPNIYFATCCSRRRVRQQVRSRVWCWRSSTRARSAPARRVPLSRRYLRGVHGAVVERAKADQARQPLDSECMVGAQASKEQYDKILSYIEIGRAEGAEVLIGGGPEPARWRSAPASTCSRPCSRAPTTCACSRKRSSARWWA
jgi:aldehyde dehydrogenase